MMMGSVCFTRARLTGACVTSHRTHRNYGRTILGEMCDRRWCFQVSRYDSRYMNKYVCWSVADRQVEALRDATMRQPISMKNRRVAQPIVRIVLANRMLCTISCR